MKKWKDGWIMFAVNEHNGRGSSIEYVRNDQIGSISYIKQGLSLITDRYNADVHWKVSATPEEIYEAMYPTD